MPVILFNFTMVCVGLLMSRLLALNAKDITAVIIEHTIRQEATGIYIALVLLGSLMTTVPLIINTIIGMGVSMLVVLVGRRFNKVTSPQ